MSGPDKNQVDSPYTVGVYYYPWYSGDFHGGRYMRKELIPPQLPMLGEYDDRNPSVIAQHLKWSRQANISLWVASWWGPDSREDQTLVGGELVGTRFPRRSDSATVHSAAR